MLCPRCKQALDLLDSDYGKVYICFSCFGHLGSKKKLEDVIPTQRWVQMDDSMKQGKKSHSFPCPHCQKLMNEVNIGSEKESLLIDVCNSCGLTWFDAKELEEIATHSPPQPESPAKSPGKQEKELSAKEKEAKQAMARAEVILMKHEAEQEPEKYKKRLLNTLTAQENDTPQLLQAKQALARTQVQLIQAEAELKNKRDYEIILTGLVPFVKYLIPGSPFFGQFNINSLLDLLDLLDIFDVSDIFDVFD